MTHDTSRRPDHTDGGLPADAFRRPSPHPRPRPAGNGSGPDGSDPRRALTPSPWPRVDAPREDGSRNGHVGPDGGGSTLGGAVGAVGDLVGMVRSAPLMDAADAIGVARVAGTAVWRAVGAVTRRSVGAATEIARDVQSGEPVSDIIDNQVEKVRSAAVSALGLDGSHLIAGALPTPAPLAPLGSTAGGAATRRPRRRGLSAEDLQRIGEGMLRASAYEANQPRDKHPAFATMLASLTPDGARILRFLAVAGPQPSLDVRTRTPFGIGSERLGGGLNMIAEMAGCSFVEHDHEYLANLNRLGLVRFSQEPVADFRRYSLIEAQPKVAEAMERASRSTTVYRSIYLSLFGQQFCAACFDTTGYDAGDWATDDRGDKILGKGTPKPRKKHH